MKATGLASNDISATVGDKLIPLFTMDGRMTIYRAAVRFVQCLAIAAACYGCASKSVTLKSEPAGAKVSILSTNPRTGVTTSVRLDDSTTPLTIKLPFKDKQTYTATFEKDQFLPATEKITFDPKDKTTYAVMLTRYLADLMQYPFQPQSAQSGWTLAPQPEKTIAYVLNTTETVTEEMPDRGLKQITSNTSPDIDFQALAASPTRDMLVYQHIERAAKPDKSYTVPKKKKMTAEEIAAANDISVADLRAANPSLRGSAEVEEETVLKIVDYDVSSRIYRHQLDRPTVSRLTSDTGNEFSPAFSPDGEFVYYSTDSLSPNATLWRVKAEGGGTRMTRVVRSDSLDFNASVGRELIAYTSILPVKTSPSEVQVWTAKIDGSEQSRIIDGNCPQISPDDQRILYVAPYTRDDQPTVDRLWLMNIDGSDASTLTANEDCTTIDPQWSPNGKFIVFAANVVQQEKLQNFDLFYMPADGSAPAVQLTNNEAYDSSPVWDRTGRNIYFRSNRGGAWNIWRITVEDISSGSQ